MTQKQTQRMQQKQEAWSFSMELLQHVHTLRLFLLPPPSSILDAATAAAAAAAAHGNHHNSAITATLQSAPPLLTCTLTRRQPAHHCEIRLPLPLLLFDYSLPPRVSVHDHAHGHGHACIEISVQLLPLHSSLCHVFSSLSITTDKTPHQPQKCEATDDSSQLDLYKEKLPPIPTLSLQDEDVTLPNNCSKGHGIANLTCRNCSTKVLKKPVSESMQMPCAEWRDIVENWFGTCCCLFCSKAEALSTRFEKSFNMRPGRCLLGLSTCYVPLSDVVTELDPMIDCTNDIIYQMSTLSYLDLGNGFMVSENEHSKLSIWNSVHCIGCQSLIGGYPCKTVAPNCSIMEGVHLFQFQINADDFLCDAFRSATLEALFVRELQLRTDEGTSYRFLIRSLTSEMPLLQLVVLNYDSSLSTGSITACACETDCDDDFLSNRSKVFPEEIESSVNLQRVMKVMFSDCSRFSTDERRSTELWVRQQDAETIYMFDELAVRLTKELHANRLFFPAECRFSEHFQGSFLYA